MCLQLSSRACIRTYVYAYARTCTHARVYTYVYVCTRMHTYAYTYSFISHKVALKDKPLGNTHSRSTTAGCVQTAGLIIKRVEHPIATILYIIKDCIANSQEPVVPWFPMDIHFY